MIRNINRESVIETLQEKISEISKQPEFSWQDSRTNFAITADGKPDVKVGIANCPLDYDLWKYLRNPAKVGRYPVGLEQIWEFWADKNKTSKDKNGNESIFKLPPSFASAKKRYKRVVIISAMLPMNQNIMKSYNRLITKKSIPPLDTFYKAFHELVKMLDFGLSRLGFELITTDRAVVVMDEKNTGEISSTIPLTHQGSAHGVSKEDHYPQPSIAVMTGLGQLGVLRILFRDEIIDGKVVRFTGPIASIVVFDKEPVVTDVTGHILNLSDKWLRTLNKMIDFTNTDPGINKYRFCTYQPDENQKSCGLCMQFCPTDALGNSSPVCDGTYPPEVEKQENRFYEDALQFDNHSCFDFREQMSEIYERWPCSRCMSICGGNGKKRFYAAENYERLLFDEKE